MHILVHLGYNLKLAVDPFHDVHEFSWWHHNNSLKGRVSWVCKGI